MGSRTISLIRPHRNNASVLELALRRLRATPVADAVDATAVQRSARYRTLVL